MSLKVLNCSEIEYEKANGQTSERVILPTFIPSKPTIKAFDVTDLSDEDRVQLTQQYAEYQVYRQQALDNLFSFEDYLEHVGSDSIDGDLKYRTFIPDNITEL